MKCNIYNIHIPFTIIESNSIFREKASTHVSRQSFSPERRLASTVAYQGDLGYTKLEIPSVNLVGEFLLGDVASETSNDDIFLCSSTMVPSIENVSSFIIDNLAGELNSVVFDYIPTDIIRDACKIDYKTNGGGRRLD